AAVVRMLAGALRAPSAHNAQPWRLSRVADDAFRLSYAFNDRLLADPDDRDGLLAMGGFFETMRLAGEANGIEVALEFEARSGRDRMDLGILRLRDLGRAPDPLALALDRRHCNRNPYSRAPLPPDLVQALGDLDTILVSPDLVAPL